jgi:hypothetical protein
MFYAVWRICNSSLNGRISIETVAMIFRRIFTIAALCVFGVCSGSTQPRVLSGQWTTVFVGVRYVVESLTPGPEGTGAIHIVEVDLSAPGIELFVTPMAPDAVRSGGEYRLTYLPPVVHHEHLAIAINASLFTSHSLGYLQLPGDLARSVETLVANHVVNHLWEHTYLLAFDDSLQPWFTLSKPPSVSDLRRARWAVGGQAVDLREGSVGSSNPLPDARTAVALDRSGQHLYFAVAKNISPRSMLARLAERGAWTGMMLDGGHSTTLVVGAGANALTPGVVVGGWRPVATGVRAKRVHE